MALMARQTADRSVCQTTPRLPRVRAQASSAVLSPLRSQSLASAFALARAAAPLWAALAFPKRALPKSAAAIASAVADRAFAPTLECFASASLVSLAGRQQAVVAAEPVAGTVGAGRLRWANPRPDGTNGHYPQHSGRLAASDPVARAESSNRAAPHPLSALAADLKAASRLALALEGSAARLVASANHPDAAFARLARLAQAKQAESARLPPAAVGLAVRAGWRSAAPGKRPNCFASAASAQAKRVQVTRRASQQRHPPVCCRQRSARELPLSPSQRRLPLPRQPPLLRQATVRSICPPSFRERWAADALEHSHPATCCRGAPCAPARKGRRISPARPEPEPELPSAVRIRCLRRPAFPPDQARGTARCWCVRPS